ncbi:uncharacterized protein C8Q71DRAFT_835013 [Rhodofomes roseus]|uniref:CHCH domain-containing protein n=1 Tax=Rhodofomes roseus TaxID=34475 RepID=A0ABQ8KFF3_9APHY|nr:uncharacterized protein C8Q71DRAFT_835013 [Rhodofomes roseus]KAH9836516.1 hypothetical protein C8Q71DRAFT_835013 [Rhodofomes roseus]
MSFGRPPSISGSFQATPPDRGSFPLDHYGECKDHMKVYLDCLRKNASNSTPCRHLNRDYLDCRMNRGLMDRDEWKNLGMSNVDSKASATKDDPHDASVKASPSS